MLTMMGTDFSSRTSWHISVSGMFLDSFRDVLGSDIVEHDVGKSVLGGEFFNLFCKASFDILNHFFSHQFKHPPLLLEVHLLTEEPEFPHVNPLLHVEVGDLPQQTFIVCGAW